MIYDVIIKIMNENREESTMIYKDFQGEKISLLGFGMMRLPLLSDGSQEIDEEQVNKMVQYAVENGVNYFDTAYPYHDGKSELIAGKVLKQFPRDSYYLASKYPGHQIASSYNPKEVFEEQLKKCQVDYFDFYLLHNVYENSYLTYDDPKWGIIDYFVEQKKLGRIKHLGFSTHGMLGIMETFLEKYGDIMEFCQIQLNYLDWTLQNGKGKYELLNRYHIPVWVMEPIRGGKLATLDEQSTAKLKELRPNDSIASWSFRWLQGLDNVKVILSGMSNMEQMIDNVKTFESYQSLSEEENHLLLDIAEGLKNTVPCTACRYCCKDCPKQLDIPTLLSLYNDMKFAPTFSVSMLVESIDLDKQPSACIGCGKCARICPQKIDIPAALKDFTSILEKSPSWADLCKAREEAMKKLQKV